MDVITSTQVSRHQVWLIGIYAIVFGVLLLIRAFQFRTASTA